MPELRFGLWPKVNKEKVLIKNLYTQGKPLEIAGEKFWVSLWDNRDSKQGETHPDFQLVLKPVEDSTPF